MLVWTIQPMCVWEALRQHGVLLVDEQRYAYVPERYRWHAEQLRRRLPHYSGGLPWWFYCEKPDLRSMRHYRPAGEAQVRLELDPTPGSFAVFPVWAWHTVYCGDYLAFSRGEYETWTAAMRAEVTDEDLWPLPEPWRTQLEASWLRLFSPDLPEQPWDDEACGRSGEREGVVGSLRRDEIREITTFVGCHRRQK